MSISATFSGTESDLANGKCASMPELGETGERLVMNARHQSVPLLLLGA